MDGPKIRKRLGGRPTRRAVVSGEDRLVDTGLLADGNPLPLVIRPVVDDFDPFDWAANHRELIEQKVLEHGGVLLRDFPLTSVEDFERMALLVTPDLVNYVEGSSPRIMLGEKVYTSTEYPPEYEVSMHSELSYAHRWPSRIFFFCLVEPQDGGETPIADNRAVLAALDEDLKERFRGGVEYLRNLHGGQGAGLAWQTVFETDDRETVERYCRDGGIEFSWSGDGGLRTRQVRPAAIRHPASGEALWFNQVDQWHPSNLGSDIAAGLLRAEGEDALPINARFGDGSPLPEADLEAVRAAYRRVRVVFPWRRGDLLVLDNMLVAHGRMPFRGPRKVVVTMGAPTGLDQVESL